MTQSEQRSAIDLIWARATFSPNQPALMLPDRTIPYDTLVRGAESVQGMLSSLPVQRGQVIAILIDNPAKHMAVLLGLMREGFTTASIRLDQLVIAIQCGIQTVFSDVDFVPPPGVTRVNVDDKWFVEQPPRQKSKTWPEDRIARIVFTSGSTGQPRAIGFTYRAVNNGIHDIGMYGVADHQRVFTMHGLSSSAFKTSLHCLAYGKTIAFGAPGTAIHMIHNYSIGCVRGSVAQARSLLLQAAAMKVISRIQTLVLGGASLPWQLHDELAWAFRCDIVSVYSSTETGNMGLSMGALLNRRPAAGSYYYPTCEVQIVDEHDKILPPGKEGRIRARTSAMGFPFNGQLTQTRQLTTSGWFLPGDTGRIEENGLLLVLGRGDEIINDGGVKFNPEQIEDYLSRLEGINEATAVRIPVGSNGFEPWLAVAGEPKLSCQQVNEWIAQNLPGEMGAVRFTRLVSLDSIPRTDGGKVARRELRARMLEQVQQKV